MRPDGQPKLGVVLLGEALGEQEAKAGQPFIGPAGFRLGLMIQRAGYERSDFQILNAIWCQPPKNNMQPNVLYYDGALEACKQYWTPHVRQPECKVIVPMGNVALDTLTGERGIQAKRGYVQWSETYNSYILPTVHPSFILQGNGNWELPFIYDLRHAVKVAAEGWTPVERDYLLDPSPNAAWEWFEDLRDELVFNPELTLGDDIETPDKSASEDETNISLGFQKGPIYRIGFAYVDRYSRTRAMSLPWDANYRSVIQAIHNLPIKLIFCYRHFDVPRILAHEIRIAGRVVDLQEKWHVLHPDLPKSLEHMAPYLVPNQPAWKHLAGDMPAFYNATDAAVQVEADRRVTALLQESGLYDFYVRHIEDLNPILIYMHQKGMPIDQERRVAASLQLMALKETNREKLNEAVQDARPTKIYKKFQEGLEEVGILVTQKACSRCGKLRVNKKHPCFTKPNDLFEPARIVETLVDGRGWAKPLDFTPSQKGLLRYATYRGYKLISRWDKTEKRRKITMDKTAVQQYALNYPEDPVWALALEERELNKLLGTYVGRVTEEPEKPQSAEDLWWSEWRKAQYTTDEDGNLVRPKTVPLGSNESGSGAIHDEDIPF